MVAIPGEKCRRSRRFDSVSRVTFSRKGTEILQYLNGGYSGREVRKELKEYTGVEVC